jgi:ribosomal protein S18 acetylase RimI-like enzyme
VDTTADAPTAALTTGRLSPGDLADVTDLLRASDYSVLGFADFADEEISADLARADLEAYGWRDPEGALVAYGWVSRQEESPKVELDAYVHPGRGPDELGLEVVAHLHRRGLELAAEAGHDHADFDIGIYRQDARSRAWFEHHGYTSPTTFVRMRVDLTDEEPPAAPGGLVVRRSALGTDDLRTAYEVEEASFTEHFGHVPSTYETWLTRLTEKGEDWAEVWLAELAGEPVGVLVGTRQFQGDENAGYVRTLGTLAKARGRGVGKALLRAYLAACRATGRDAVLLHVDVANVTDALRLYESVGMRPVLTIDAWTNHVPVVDSDTPL